MMCDGSRSSQAPVGAVRFIPCARIARLGGFVQRVPSIALSGAPARSSLYVVASWPNVTMRSVRGIIVFELARALRVSNCGFARRAKQPFVKVLVPSLTGLLTTGWSDRER
jgi:hypothetical protein